MEDFLEKGWFTYGEENIIIQQTIKIEPYIEELLNQEKPSLIIELGTSFGGFTLLLITLCKRLGLDSKIITYDNAVRWSVPELLEKYNVDFRQKTIGEPEVDQEIIDLIQSNEGKTIVFCDGGNKIGEFNKFSAVLKQGDIIGAHDYADNEDDFKVRLENKVWNWLEIQLFYIKGSIEVYNLIDLENNMTEKGKNVAWLFKRKG